MDERIELVRELMKETETEEEKIELGRYIDELRGMNEKLYDRTELLQSYETNKKSVNDLLSKVKETPEYKEYTAQKDKTKKKELQKEYQSTDAYKQYAKEKKRIDAENSALEERLELLDNEISRRDSMLLEISALSPVRDLVQRAYKIGKTEGVKKIERLGKVVGNGAIEPNTIKNGSYGNKNGVSNNVRTTADNKKVVSDSGERYAIKLFDEISDKDQNIGN